MVFVRARRSATIRTRLDVETVHERIAALAAEPAAGGMKAFLAHGHFAGWTVEPQDFRFDYTVNNPKNRQSYAVHGTVRDARDWRILRLKLTAHDPWLGRIELGFLAAFTAFYAYSGELPPGFAVFSLLFVMAVYAFANLMYIPDAVTARMAGLIASEVNGSVQSGNDWVVPR